MTGGGPIWLGAWFGVWLSVAVWSTGALVGWAGVAAAAGAISCGGPTGAEFSRAIGRLQYRYVLVVRRMGRTDIGPDECSDGP